MMENFRQSKTWESCRRLILEVYGITKDFPDRAGPRLTNQIRRFPVLISGNVARILQEKDPDLRSQLLMNAELYLNKLNTVLQTAHKKGYLQNSTNQSIIKEMYQIRTSLKAIIR